MKKTILSLLVASCGLFSTTVIHAASSDWHDLGGGKARLIAIKDPDNNQISGMVQIRLDEGWKTYWRSPGESGIPPQFDFTSSSSFIIDPVKFPIPELIHMPDTYLIGYKGNVSFPFSGLADANHDHLDLSLLIGVCKDVCIPASAKFSISQAELNQTDMRSQMEISLANSSIPKKPSEQFGVEETTTISNHQLNIITKSPKSEIAPTLFVEGPADWYLGLPKLIENDEISATFTLSIQQTKNIEDLVSSGLRYTLISGNEGVEGQLEIME